MFIFYSPIILFIISLFFFHFLGGLFGGWFWLLVNLIFLVFIVNAHFDCLSGVASLWIRVIIGSLDASTFQNVCSLIFHFLQRKVEGSLLVQGTFVGLWYHSLICSFINLNRNYSFSGSNVPTLLGINAALNSGEESEGSIGSYDSDDEDYRAEINLAAIERYPGDVYRQACEKSRLNEVARKQWNEIRASNAEIKRQRLLAQQVDVSSTSQEPSIPSPSVSSSRPAYTPNPGSSDAINSLFRDMYEAGPSGSGAGNLSEATAPYNDLEYNSDTLGALLGGGKPVGGELPQPVVQSSLEINLNVKSTEIATLHEASHSAALAPESPDLQGDHGVFPENYVPESNPCRGLYGWLYENWSTLPLSAVLFIGFGLLTYNFISFYSGSNFSGISEWLKGFFD